MKISLLALVCLLASVSAVAQVPPKLMDAPSYALGQGTIFDTSHGVVILPNGSLPVTCKANQALMVGGVLNLCSSINTWVAIPALTGPGTTVPVSQLPSVGTLSGQLVNSQFPATIPSSTTGNAATATAFAATPTGCASGLYATGINALGNASCSQVQASQVAGLSPSATIDSTNANNISSGTLNAGRLPASVLFGTQIDSLSLQTAPTGSPAPGQLFFWADSAGHNLQAKNESGITTVTVVPAVAPAHQFVTGYGTNGLAITAQPTAQDILGLSASALSDTTNAANILTGILNPARLPYPSPTAIGGVQSIPYTVSQWVDSISNQGIPHSSRPNATDILGLAASATIDTTDAQNITKGVLDIARLPHALTATAFSGILPLANLPTGIVFANQANTYTNVIQPATPPLNMAAVWVDISDQNLKVKNGLGATTVTVSPINPTSGQFVTGIAANGQVTTGQVQATDVVGLAPSAISGSGGSGGSGSGGSGSSGGGPVLPSQLPLPTTSTIGAIFASVQLPHLWIDAIQTNGQPHLSQPDIHDLTGASPSAIIDTTDAGNISRGILDQNRLPGTVLRQNVVNVLNVQNTPGAPPAVGTADVWVDASAKNLRVENEVGTVFTSVQPQAVIPHQYITGLTLGGVLSLGPITVADVVGLSASASHDTTDASQIISGTLDPARLASTISSNTTGNAGTATAFQAIPTPCPNGQYAQGIAANGNAICSVVQYGQLGGTSGGGGGGGGTPGAVSASDITTGTLPDSVLPHDVVTSVINDSVVTGLIQNNTLTLGWTGTLPASRLNSSVVQNVVNDPNVIGSINNQQLVLGWSGSLAVERGGTGANTASAGFDTLAPTRTIGDTIYFNGASNVALPGNTSTGTQFLCETGNGTSSAAPAWCPVVASNVTGLSQSAIVDTTDAGNISAGTIDSARLPLPTLAAGGAVKAVNPVAHQWVQYIDNNGDPVLSQIQASDISGLPASSYSDTTNASNILTGTLGLNLFPATINSNTTGNAATATALSGNLQPCQYGLYATGIGATGNAICSQVQYGQIGALPTIPTDNSQLLNGASYITGTDVPRFLPVTAVKTDQINTYIDQFEPVTPANGFTEVWTDKVNMVLTAKNSQGFRTITVAPSQAPPNEFATGILLNGIMTYSKINVSQIQGITTSGLVDTTIADNITTGTLHTNIFPVTIPSNTTGNAATATALASIPSTCPTGQVATGISPTGNAICINFTAGSGGGGGSAPIATATTPGIVAVSAGLSVDVSGNERVAYGTASNTALQGSTLNAANGVAGLDANTLVPLSELPAVAKVQLPSATLPSCSSTTAGTFVRIAGTGSNPDTIQVCINSGSGVYAWLTLGSGSSSGSGGVQNPLRTFSASTSITWAHNLNSTTLLPFVWGADNSVLEYGSFVESDANDASLSFAVPATGTVKVIPAAYVQSFVNATNVTVGHNMNSYNIVPIVLDSQNSVVQPSSFVLSLANQNSAILTFSSPQSGRILIAPTAGAYSSSFTSATSISLNHNLNSLQLGVAAYDTNNVLTSYGSFTPTDANNSTLTFSTPQSGKVVVIKP